jgi:hypothetical protein
VAQLVALASIGQRSIKPERWLASGTTAFIRGRREQLHDGHCSALTLSALGGLHAEPSGGSAILARWIARQIANGTSLLRFPSASRRASPVSQCAKEQLDETAFAIELAADRARLLPSRPLSRAWTTGSSC